MLFGSCLLYTSEQKKNDWALKVLAVVFAVILWFYADAEQNPMTGRQFDVPVQYINQAEDYVVADGVSTVRVTIRGKEADLTSLRSDDFTATVDLTNAVAGSGEYDITAVSYTHLDVYKRQLLVRRPFSPAPFLLVFAAIQTQWHRDNFSVLPQSLLCPATHSCDQAAMFPADRSGYYPDCQSRQLHCGTDYRG